MPEKDELLSFISPSLPEQPVLHDMVFSAAIQNKFAFAIRQ